jgi:hypothetical protein
MPAPEKSSTTPSRKIEHPKESDSSLQNAVKFAALLVGLAALGYVLLKVLPGLFGG